MNQQLFLLVNIAIIFCLVACSRNSNNFVETGFDQYYKGNFSEAIDVFSEGILLDNESKFECYLGRAFCYYELSDLDKAKMDLDSSLKVQADYKEPNWVLGKSHQLLGYIHSQKGNQELELAEYLEAEKYIGDDSELLTSIGLCKIEMEDVQSGISYLSKAIGLNKEDAFAYNNRAMGFIKLHEFNKAWRDLEKSKELNPDNPYLLKNYGLYYMADSQMDKACQFFKLALTDKYDGLWWHIRDKNAVESMYREICQSS